MKWIGTGFVLLFLAFRGTAQRAEKIITINEVTRIETALAGDEMQGRKPGTPGGEKAARFIADEFRKAGLQPFAGAGFMQSFSLLRPRAVSVKGEVDDRELPPGNIIVSTPLPELKVNEKMGYAVEHISSGSLAGQVQAIRKKGRNAVVFIDTLYAPQFVRLASPRPLFQTDPTLIYVLGAYHPREFTFKAEHQFEEVPYANVVGVLPGGSKKDEIVVFSGHYDHLGIGRPVGGDSVYNGANDDAAGITAVILLAKYFKELGQQERTLVFAAFTAEESGGFGSQYFSRQLNPDKVVAMFNIEMIGTESRWGKKSAYITGFEKSDMGPILQKALKKTPFRFYPDPYPAQNLFYRSDNATLARLGVPAHTISTAKMEGEPNYHKPSDEVQTLDLQNMTQIIRAIARSAATIVSGKETPSRVRDVQ